ncbi:MAG: hypothetical protein EP318_06700 [Rhodobacteraceae bacterium]|nr:MAG: hypothetical protein EP318_06700 [Paracoccaceae bacterium]
MKTEIARRAARCFLLGLMIAFFADASYHLGVGVIHDRTESLMTGGFLMFAAVTLAWLRMSLNFSAGRNGEGHLRIRTDWMSAETA